MSDARTNVGSKLFISTTTVSGNLDQTGFEALTFVEIGKVGSCGEFAVDETIAEYQQEDGNTLKAKGFLNPQNVEFEFVPDYSDTGQDQLRTAAGTPFCYAFKREKKDALNATGTNSIYYGIGPVKTPMPVTGTGDEFIRHSSVIGLSFQPVFVEPTAGV